MNDERRITKDGGRKDEGRRTNRLSSHVSRPSSVRFLFALALFLTLYAAPWTLFSSPTDLDITANTTWSGDQTITGTLTVKAGVTLGVDSSSGTPITITATNLVVEAGAKITADGKGYAGGTARSNGAGAGGGKGVGVSNTRSAGGAGYGGIGGDGTGYANSGGSSYGASSPPLVNGSGGGGGQAVAGGAGGGAIKFVISGKTSLSGPVSANGADGTGAPYGSGAGSGGSIHLTTSILEGTANITANGGNAVDGSGGKGGGGRVALYYDDAGGYSGTVSVLAGTTGAGSPADGSTGRDIFCTGGNSGVGPMGVYPNAIFTGGASGAGPQGVGFYYSGAIVQCIWTGDGADNLASTAENWYEGRVPVDGSTVVFIGVKNCTWDITVTLANLNLNTGYTGTVTLSATPGQDLTVTNTITVETQSGKLADNGRNVNFKNASFPPYESRLISTGSWKMIASGTLVNDNYGAGFYSLEIPTGVTATLNGITATKRLIQGDNSKVTGSTLYLYYADRDDFVTQGTGAVLSSAVAIFHTVSRRQGALTATGSVDLMNNNGCVLTMTGHWNVGGAVAVSAGGYGHVGTLDTNGYDLNVGSYLRVAPSTAGYFGKVFFKTGTHTIGGKIYVDAGSGAAGGTCFTHGYIDFGSSTVNVGGDIDFRGASVIPGTSTVNLTGATAATIYSIVDYSYKDTTEPWRDDLRLNTAPFYKLTSSVAGKTIKFEAGKTVTIANNLSLAGASGNLLTLKSSTAGAYANLNIAGAATNMNYLSVQDSNASSGKSIVATNSTNVSNNTNWFFGVAGTVYWTNGSGDGKWSTAANWSTGAVPIATDSVVFNTVSTAHCDVDQAVTLANLNLNTGYTGTVTLSATPGQDLTVTNTITVETQSGKLADNGRNVNFKNASFPPYESRLISTGSWKMIASGTLVNDNYGAGFYSLEIPTGVTATLNGITATKRLIQGDNSKVTGSTLYLYYADRDDFVTQGTGAVLSSAVAIFHTVSRRQGALTATGSVDLMNNNGCVLTMTGHWNVGGAVAVSAGGYGHVGTLDTNGYDLNVGSYLRVAPSTAGYFGKVFFKTGTHTIGGKIYVDAGSGAAGGTCFTHGYIDFGSSTVNVGGDIDFRGASVIPGTSTVNLTGATAATIYSIVDYSYKDTTEPWRDDLRLNTAPFYKLTSSVAGKTIKFEAGKTVTIANNLSLAGASGNLLTLNSSTAGAYANLNIAGAATNMNYLSVQDSNASSGKSIVAIASTDAGHNLAWAFSGPQDHLGFASSIANQQAGVSFTLPQLVAHDLNHTVLSSFSGAKTITYALSGTSDAPDGNGTDKFYSDGVLNGPVNFTDGVSTSVLTAVLYRAQDTTVTPSEPSLLGTDSASNTVTVSPIAAEELRFAQQPSPTAIITAPFVQQPRVTIVDPYGNRTHDTFSIKLYSSATSESPFGDAGGILASDHGDNTLAAVNGLAIYSGLKYDRAGLIYLYAEALGAGSGLVPAFSTGVTLATAQSTVVAAADSPVASFTLTPTNDTWAEKFAVLKFKVSDLGSDNIPTQIDQMRIAIGGTGLNASTDIAWAGLYVGATQVAVASSITDGGITFGLAPDDNTTADLYNVADNTATEFTVYIYMMPQKLAAIEGKTYTFATNESYIGVDTGGATSTLTADTSAVATVTGTITVVMSHLEVVTPEGESTATLVAGTPVEWLVRATDANKNIDINYGGNRTLVFAGLNSVGTAPVYNPKIENTKFGSNITIGFTQGVSNANAVTLTAYKRETGTVVVQEGGRTYVQNGLTATVGPALSSNLAILSGNNQSGRISWELGQPFVAVVTDAYTNNADTGTAVNFAIASQPPGAAGAVLSVMAGNTDSNGAVATTLTVGSLPGVYQVSATSAGLGGSPLTFRATGLSPFAIQLFSGDHQSKQVFTALDSPLVAKVVDVGGIPIPNETVNFVISSAPEAATGQVLSASSVVTDAGGLAPVTLTLGTKAGDYIVGVTSGVLPAVEFTATGTAKAPYQVALSGPVSVKAGEVSGIFTVLIQDEYANLSNLSSATAFSLTQNPARPSGGFYANSDDSGSIASLSIAGGSSSGSFYYKDTVVGTANLVVTRTSGQMLTTPTRTQGVTIMPADAFRFTVTGSTAAISTGGTKILTLTTYDNQGNVKTDYNGDVNVVFSGAAASPSPTAKAATCSNKNSQDINFGASTTLRFTSGVAATTAKLYKAEAVVLRAKSGAVDTAIPDALGFTVAHGTPAHLKFSGNLPAMQTAGGEFTFDTTLAATDLYDNICDGADGGEVFSGSRQITWTLSGESNGPEGNVIDEFVSPVAFDAGVSTTVLKAKLYRAQNTTLTAGTAALTGTNVASNMITIASGPASKLRFSSEPSAFCVTSQPLGVQPKISVSDPYGNPATVSSVNVTLDASTTTGTFTPVVNGLLSATGGLTAATVNGVASFSGLTYSYPENVYLRATVSGIGLTPIYSSGITFSLTDDGTFSAGAPGAAEVPSTANSSADKVGVLNFRIVDGGLDGFAITIKQIIIKRDTADATGGWTSFIQGASMTDGVTTIVGKVEDDQISFGLGTNDIYRVANGITRNFTVSIYLKNPLPLGSDNKLLSFKLDPATGILLGTSSSSLKPTNALTVSPRISVGATDFFISGSATMNAGDSQEIILKAGDALGNVDTNYAGEKVLILSGANVSFAGNIPIETASQLPFGSETPVSFTAGQSSSTVGIRLYAAETVFIRATEGSSGITTQNKNALNVRVAGGAATGLSWYTQPVAAAVENAPWKEFSIIVVDAFGNTSSSAPEVTVTPSTGNLSAGISGVVRAQGGFATFYDFAVKDLEDGDKITLNGTATGLAPTGASREVTISKKYSIVLNVKDSVTQGGLTNVSLTITNSDTGEIVIVPTHNSPWSGNSPFKDNFKLTTGAYTLSLEREEYVGSGKDVMAGAVQDGLDGNYDSKITWDIYMTSIAESMADYKGIADFVYDEANDVLNIAQRLERRGQQKLSDGVNNLGIATIEIFDGANKIGALMTTPDAQGNYWYSIPDATTVVPAGPLVSSPFTTALVNGKTYFARCRIFYGGVNGDQTSYSSGTTFTITVTERLSKEIINSIGVQAGEETLASRIAAVQTAVSAVSSKVDSKGDAVIAKVESVGTQVTAVNANVLTATTKIDAVQGKVGAIQTDVSSTLPAQILANMEKGVMSEMLTRNTVIREDDGIKIRYRTASGLAPKLTVITPDGTILADYDGVTMAEINKTGIYEYEVTATAEWGVGEFTVECSEPTKGSKDSMVLTVKALYTAGAGVQESVDAVGEAVTKVYLRQKAIESLLGSAKDATKLGTIFAKVNGVTSKLDSLNLTSVSSDTRDAKENAENVYNELKTMTSGMADMKTQSATLRQLTSQLEEMRANLSKASKSLGAVGAGGEVTISGGGTNIITEEGGAGGGLSVTDQKDLISLLKDAKGIKKATVAEAESKDLNNRIEELTALVKVLGQMVENTGNKPIIEGWFEQG
jgi:hypothetical protein